MSRDTQPNRPRWISFSGIDGAGKSTQIRALHAFLEERGLRVRIVAFWDDVASLPGLREGAGHKIFRGDKGIGSPEKPINRRDKNVQSASMTLVRLGLYMLDAISLRRVMKRTLRSGDVRPSDDVVIFDRFLYDELANLNLRNPLLRVYARMLLWFVPSPDASFVLDADPLTARARKPEYPVEFLVQCRRRYLELSRLAKGITVIHPGLVSVVKSEILERVTSRMSFEARSNAFTLSIPRPSAAAGDGRGATPRPNDVQPAAMGSEREAPFFAHREKRGSES